MTSTTPRRSRRKLAIILTVLMFVTMIMGTGPGLRLINPDPERPETAFSVFGLPTVYAWGLLWYAVQVVIVLVACFTLWRPEGGENASDN